MSPGTDRFEIEGDDIPTIARKDWRAAIAMSLGLVIGVFVCYFVWDSDSASERRLLRQMRELAHRHPTLLIVEKECDKHAFNYQILYPRPKDIDRRVRFLVGIPYPLRMRFWHYVASARYQIFHARTRPIWNLSYCATYYFLDGNFDSYEDLRTSDQVTSRS
jgi:hypothetical protein